VRPVVDSAVSAAISLLTDTGSCRCDMSALQVVGRPLSPGSFQLAGQLNAKVVDFFVPKCQRFQPPRGGAPYSSDKWFSQKLPPKSPPAGGARVGHRISRIPWRVFQPSRQDLIKWM
jgi:hypothetical protein